MINILKQLLDLIEKIPSAFWGIVIGSFFTLLGTVIANRANDRRLLTQINNDREMRKRERELTLRKDVYLSAAEAISAGIKTVGRFADLEIPDNKLTEDYTNKSSAIAKVELIANEQTTGTLKNLVGELSATYLHLFSKRIPLSAQRIQISVLQQQINNSLNEEARMIELMKQFNLDGLKDNHRWETINNNFKFEQERVDKISKERDILQKDLLVRQLQFAKECIDEANRLSLFTVPAIVSVRAELEMPIDEQVYAEMIEKNIKKQGAALEAFIESIRSLVATQQGNASNAQKQ